MGRRALSFPEKRSWEDRNGAPASHGQDVPNRDSKEGMEKETKMPTTEQSKSPSSDKVHSLISSFLLIRYLGGGEQHISKIIQGKKHQTADRQTGDGNC